MRFIPKAAEPNSLRVWKQENRDAPQVLEFSNLTLPVRQVLHESMLKEQGWLCAYTMIRIGRAVGPTGAKDFHIEHILPRSRHPDRSLNYDNMVLCSPGPMAAQCGYGAQKKGGADVNGENFVSPLNPTCESRLSYRLNGEVRATTTDDAAAIRTVHLLALNHPNLVEARIEALRSHGLGPNARRPISAAKAIGLADLITKADQNGQIPSLCIAIKQVAERFAQQRRAHAARLNPGA